MCDELSGLLVLDPKAVGQGFGAVGAEAFQELGGLLPDPLVPVEEEPSNGGSELWPETLGP